MVDRMQRVDALLREELSRLLEENVEQFGMIDITAVLTSRDLDHAEVWVVPVSGQWSAFQLDELQRQFRQYRHRLHRRLRLKRIPLFTVKFDTTGEQINHVEELLDQLKAVQGSSQEDQS